MSASNRVAAVSIDLDEIDCYEGIHAINLSDDVKNSVYDKALARFLELLDELQIKSTLFVIGSDLVKSQPREELLLAHAQGHELASHSYSHAYDITTWSYDKQLADLKQSILAIEGLIGAKPRGFRAPGYMLSANLIRAISDAGFHYDSSVLPCPSYFAAKLTVLGWMALQKKKSRSVASPKTSAAMASAPREPYRMRDDAFHKRGNGLLELPVAVTHRLRLPVIGTSLALFGRRGAESLVRGVLGSPFINIEFHGIDLLDASDGLAELAKYQPDLRISWPLKRAIFHSALSKLKTEGYTFTRLDKHTI